MPKQDKFHEHLRQLAVLERWRELAIRPSPNDCRPEDLDLLDLEMDDCCELQRRCQQVRDQLNQNNCLPLHFGDHEDNLVAEPSSILGAGLGLYYKPQQSAGATSTRIPEGSLLCHYYGHPHDFHSAKQLKDRSYLMSVREDILVDPGPLLHIKARYINDPLNEKYVNCEYVPEKYRSAVIATRDIHPGEEIFVSYGDGYWSQHNTPGRPEV